jgi:DNA helicase-2/ATP-dependent DNA helicase PcrA
MNGLSSFIQDLPGDVVYHESTSIQQRFSDHKWSLPSSDNFRTDKMVPSGFCQGDRVRHPAFGHGVVSKFVSDDKVEVLFREVGRKLLHLEYTTLEKI